MSVSLTPLSPRSYTVGAADDPYKKYWWAILAGFVVTGAWLCIPIMETPVGSVHVDAAAKPGVDAAVAEQSLDSADNPSGARGGALDLAMDGSRHKDKGGVDDMASMLYQAAPEAGAAAAGKPLGDATAASASTLAQQLKDAGKKAAASGWTEKAQRGFDSPHLGGAGLSGTGSAHGGSNASAGGDIGAFGTRNASVSYGSTVGLRDDGASESAGFKALRASAGAAANPNLKGSAEAMHAGMARAFDGAKGKAPAQVGKGAMAQANAALDAAPADLKTKIDDPKLDAKKLPTPAPTAAAAADDMGKKLAMMAATALIGGMIPGAGGQMVMMMGTMMIQQQEADAAKARQDALDKQRGVKPS